MKTATLHGTVGLTGFKHTREGFEVSTNRVLQVKIPHRITTRDIRRMQKDFQGLADVARDYPEKLKAFLEASLHNNVLRSKNLADEVGLNEREFRSQGGGLIWWIIAAIIAADILLDGLPRLGVDSG